VTVAIRCHGQLAVPHAGLHHLERQAETAVLKACRTRSKRNCPSDCRWGTTWVQTVSSGCKVRCSKSMSQISSAFLLPSLCPARTLEMLVFV
jgi:hypothetical protein